MRKILVFILGFILICFIIPLIFAKKFKSEEVISQVTESAVIEENKYDYKKYNVVKVLHTENNQIEEIELDKYLYGVVSSEMPVDFEIEALKAQAIVARTYTIYKINTNNKKHGDADICDSSACCQAWISKEERMSRWDENIAQGNWDKIVLAVESTKGKIVTYNGEPINAFFHSNSGGITEMPVNVWGGNDYPYLQAVATSGEDTYSQYASEIILTKNELTAKMKEKYSDFEINFDLEDCIKILEYTESNRVKTIKIGNKNLSGVELRTICGLKSTNFQVSIENDNIKFSVKGYGHGVGMSQTGADSMAKEGKSCEEIINHFYSGVEIQDI